MVRMRAAVIAANAQEELDAFQLDVAHEWRQSLAWWSVALSALFGAGLTYATEPRLLLVMAIICPFVGGFSAWVLRDLTATVETWRRR